MDDLRIGEHVTIHPTARINVTERLVIGAYSDIGENCIIAGRDVEIGQEFWMDDGAVIGGGSCFEKPSSFRAGHFLHMGRDSFINTARPVILGNEVGLGMRTSIFTHGAYLSPLRGFPVSFGPVTVGDRAWLPGATVNPGVTIGSDVVIGVGSVVTSDVPNGALAAGVPAKVIDQRYAGAAYKEEEVWPRLKQHWLDLGESLDRVRFDRGQIRVDQASFNPWQQTIYGPVTDRTERMRNELRRWGIRFYSRPTDGEYKEWRLCEWASAGPDCTYYCHLPAQHSGSHDCYRCIGDVIGCPVC